MKTALLLIVVAIWSTVTHAHDSSSRRYDRDSDRYGSDRYRLDHRYQSRTPHYNRPSREYYRPPAPRPVYRHPDRYHYQERREVGINPCYVWVKKRFGRCVVWVKEEVVYYWHR